MLVPRILLCALAIGGLAVPASATISYYAQDQGGYNAALTSSGLSVTNIDFASFAGPATTGTIIDVQFAGFDGGASPANLSTLANFGGGWPAGTLLNTAGTGGSIVITFAPGVRGFGFTFGPAGGNGNLTIKTVSSQSSDSYNQNNASNGIPYFFGAIAPTAGDGTFTSVTITAFSSVRIDLGGFSEDAVAAVQSGVPEVNSVSMAIIGLALLALKSLRRRFV